MNTQTLKPYQTRFIQLAIEFQALRFGEFTLKSGRVSPYFFNAGNFSSGRALDALGTCYADAIVDRSIECDFLFGPAYKGIPLVAVTVAALARNHGIDRPYCFNRKEAKDHGEGGIFVGCVPAGRGLLVDDVITAGTAIREAVGLLTAAGAGVAAVLIGLDRQERGADSAQSATQQLGAQLGIRVESIVALEHIRAYLAADGDAALLQRVDAYRKQYGA